MSHFSKRRHIVPDPPEEIAGRPDDAPEEVDSIDSKPPKASEQIRNRDSGEEARGEVQPRPSLPKVELPGGARRITDTGADLGQLLAAQKTHFVRGGTVVRVIENDLQLSQVKPTNLQSDFEKVATLVKAENRGERKVLVAATCTKAQAEGIMSSNDFLEKLPKLNVLSRCPVLVEEAGKLVTVTGYHPSGVYAAGSRPPELPLEESVKVLSGLLDEYRFTTPGDRSRALALLVTPALVMGGLLSGRAPMEIIEADASQTGKGFLLRLRAAIYDANPGVVTLREKGTGNLQSCFDRNLIDGKIFITIDNVRGNWESQWLESFLTEDSYTARPAYKEETAIDPRTVLVSLTSNNANAYRDLAFRSSCIRLLKQPAGHTFKTFPEGDVIQHVQANRNRYQAAVFGVVKEWYLQGKPVNPETRHDRRAWAGILSWIVQHLFKTAPLLDGHQQAQERITDPDLNWLRELLIAAKTQGKLGQTLLATDLAAILHKEGRDVPGLKEGESLDDDSVLLRVQQMIGRKLSKRFENANVVEIEGLSITRENWKDDNHRDRLRYVISAVQQPTDDFLDPAIGSEDRATREAFNPQGPGSGHDSAPQPSDPTDAPSNTPLMRPLIKPLDPTKPTDTSVLHSPLSLVGEQVCKNKSSIGSSVGSVGAVGKRESVVSSNPDQPMPEDWMQFSF